MRRTKHIAIVLMLLAIFAPVVFAQNYIEVWPEGWSEIKPLFTTNIFIDRFVVIHDSAGISFLSADGSYFKELDLTYRFIQDGVMKEEIVLNPKAEINSIYLGLDEDEGRHVLWLERSPNGNRINYTTFTLPYSEREPITLIETDRTIQDLTAFQSEGTIYVAWSERETYFQIRYLVITDGNVDLIETVTDTDEVSVKPNLVVDTWGTVHLSWMETSEKGVEIQYNKRSEDGWGYAQKIGDGSAQDIQQGGSITMAVVGDEVSFAWSAQPRNSSRLAVFMTKVGTDGPVTTPTSVVMGSRARFVEAAGNIELVWQGTGVFGSQVNYLEANGGLTNLTVGRKGAFRPEAYYKDGFRYVYWLQAEADGTYQVYGINNQYPKVMSIWRKVGIDENAPFYHILFLFTSTFMMAAVYTVLNIGVLVVVMIIHTLLQRNSLYKRQGLFYQVALIGTLVMVVRRLPIPSGSPGFYGLVHYGLSYTLATLGTFLILRKVRQRGSFLTIGIIIVWLLLYNFFALIPQTILH